MESRTVTVEDVIDLVRRLPADKLAVAYDFMAFIQARADAGDDWLNDSEETMAAEDAQWDAVAARHADKRAQMEAQIAAAPALPMFDESGRWLVDDYADRIRTDRIRTDANFEAGERGA